MSLLYIHIQGRSRVGDRFVACSKELPISTSDAICKGVALEFARMYGIILNSVIVTRGGFPKVLYGSVVPPKRLCKAYEFVPITKAGVAEYSELPKCRM